MFDEWFILLHLRGEGSRQGECNPHLPLLVYLLWAGCGWVANFCSHPMILPWDFSSILPLALTPIPSLLIFSARETTLAGVLSLDIGVPVRSLNRLPHPLHK